MENQKSQTAFSRILYKMARTECSGKKSDYRSEILQRQRSYCYPAAGLSALASWLNSLNQLGDILAEGYASIHETVT